MDKIQIEKRPLLADRLQISVSTKYQMDLDKISYIEAVKRKYLEFKKEYPIKYDSYSHNYYFKFDKNLIPFWSYIGNPQLKLDNPYTIKFEYNFIKAIRNFIWSDSSENICYRYDKNICIAEKNYIDKNIWKSWNNNLVQDLELLIENTCKSYASEMIKFYIPNFDLEYENVTLKHCEFNIDYHIGRNKSSDILHELQHFLISAEGVEWINDLNGYALNFYSAKDIQPNINSYGDLYNPTLKFYIAKGIFFKIYRKTADHIRFEITFEGSYIKRKFGKQAFTFVYPKLKKFAKQFFRRANFEEVIQKAATNSYADHFSLIDNIYKFLDLTYPELAYILDSIIHNNAISSPEAIKFIRENRQLTKYFESNYTKYGRRVYRFNPDKVLKPRKTRLKPAVKTKKKIDYKKPLHRCTKCDKLFRGDVCPNCQRNYWLNHKEKLKKSINWFKDNLDDKNRSDYSYFY